ncbi:type III-B CRISPR-associated protein Cas10/Cmr2 [Archangium violaceum]|uniref:type III-B CRISPR-associated protein Cas10/Cmr2 n=1 Tax=Archangium violaceum TaxID=83451 RepID=UPI00194EA52C|nr:type III-B CRISPR-associated protein Cas10/Cmr2 [Archangium violaceum]QRN96599.1 type III-B CRISPR-associated protein Cas10/Cmr2 [Archangium violaceum]
MSTAHLLLMSLGPVQDFIAQARRTRDLWFGSHVLSELSLEAARTAQKLQAELIFPALVEGEEAAPSVPNKLLVLVRQGDPREVARAAREAARTRLRDWGMEVWYKHPQLVDAGALGTAQEQLGTLLEFHAAWCSFSPPDEYRNALSFVEAALAERKRLRPFAPWKHQRGGRHKSSLDGARESVLVEGRREGGDWSRFRIGRREELDAIGLLKRTGGKPGQFIPVPTIGLAAYTALAKETKAPAMERLRRECSRFLTPVQPGKREWVRDFPFDAQLLLPGRWSTYLEEQELEREVAERFGQDFVRPLLATLGEPFPYVACLMADGDKMGETLQTLASHGPTAHQSLSRTLSGFASEARRIIEEQHRGVLVYAGGDDVVGFVCLPDALGCAAELSRAFSAAMKRGLEGRGVKEPTLSVGLGVGHVLESLGDLLDLGRRAEQLAKGEDRNGFALLARLRSSREHAWRLRWSDGPVKAIEDTVTLREKGTLPMTKVREVYTALRRIPRHAVSPQDEARWRPVLLGEVQRVLARVEAGTPGAGLTPQQAGLDLKEDGTLEELHTQVEAWAERVFLAEMLSRATLRSRGDTRGAA